MHKWFFYSDLISYVTSGPVLGLELKRRDAVTEWRQLLGPTDASRAKEEAPRSVRARFGKSKTQNAAHGSDSKEAAKRVRQL